MANYFDGYLGKIFADGIEQELGIGINLKGGLAVSFNSTTKLVEIETDSQVDLADTDAVTGVLPVENQEAQALGGDASGTTAAAVVDKIKGTAVTTAGGALTTGSVLRATGAAAADWGAVDLADTDAVTGVLPEANQADQTLGGDASGATSAATVNKIKGTAIATAGGALTTGHVLKVTGVNTADWGAKTAFGDLQYLDTTNSPVALYKLDGVMTDFSGNGFDMSVETGTEMYADVVPGKRGFYFNGSTKLIYNTFSSTLAITGAVTLIAIIQCDVLLAIDGLISHGASGEASDTNLLYNAQIQALTPQQLGWLHEHGGGTNDAYNPTGSARMPPIHNLVMVGWSRDASNVVTMNINGRTVATSGTLTAADGGGSGRLRLGGTGDATSERFVMFSAKVVAAAYSEAQFKAEFNRSLGPVYGEWL